MSDGGGYSPSMAKTDAAALLRKANAHLKKQVVAARDRDERVELASVLLEARGESDRQHAHWQKLLDALADARLDGVFGVATAETDDGESGVMHHYLWKLWAGMDERLRTVVDRHAKQRTAAKAPKRGRRADRIAQIVARIDRPVIGAWWTERPALEDLVALVVLADPTLAAEARGEDRDRWGALRKAVDNVRRRRSTQ